VLEKTSELLLVFTRPRGMKEQSVVIQTDRARSYRLIISPSGIRSKAVDRTDGDGRTRYVVMGCQWIG
jgi:hypothetical protein